MSDNDIRRIADAIEKLAAYSKKDSPWEVIADIHEGYGKELNHILDTENHDPYEVAKMLRNLQARALSTANEIRTKLV